jgi:DMSO/TMAO reductase YedYZ heme-binding membrane subunit
MASRRGGGVIAASETWFLARGTGVVSLLLLTGVVVLGIVGRVGWSNRRWPRFLTQGLHRNLSLLAVAFIGVHVATSVIDGYAPIRWIDALVPFGSAYRPVWLGLGAVAFDLVLALVLTSLLRVHLGLRAWRAIHWLAYACWPVAVLHGLGSGSDTRSVWMLGVVTAAVATVAWAIAWRVRRTDPEPWIRTTVATAGAVGVAGVAAFLALGPLQTGWAGTAGTPAGAQAAAAVGDTLPASATFTGSLDEQAGTTGRVELRMSGTLDASTPLQLAIDLSGTPSRGGFSVSGGSVALGPDAQPARFSGSVTAIDGGRIHARLAGPGGGAVDFVADLTIQGRAVSGTVALGRAA